jgi:hypothetical protein
MKPAKLTLSLLCVAALAGCVRQELEECLTTINLSYRGDGDTEIFSEKISHVDLYVFSEDERVVDGFNHYQLTPAEIAAQSVQVQLPTGANYTAVAICNMENSAVADLENGNIFDSKIMHPVTHPDIQTGDRRVDTQDHLYGGDEALEIPQTAGTTHTINLVSGHAEMIVEVFGFEEVYGATTRQGTTGLELEHRGLPAYTDFSGNAIIPESEWISQFPPRRRVAEEVERSMYTHEYQVMRDVKGSTIHIYNGDEEVVSIDVEKYVHEKLMPNPNIPGPYDENGNLLQEAVIPIRIDLLSDVEFTVTIPDWALEDVTPEF